MLQLCLYTFYLNNFKASEDQESIENRLNAMTEMSREFKAKLIAKESELDATSENLRDLRSEHATTRVDAEGMLKVMSTFAKKIEQILNKFGCTTFV